MKTFQNVRNRLKSLRSSHISFWQEHPALSFAISTLLGALLFFDQIYGITFVWLAYVLFLFSWKGLVHGLILLTVFLQSYFLYANLPAAQEGQAVFSIHSVKPHSTPFQTGWLYQGKLLAFQNHENRWTLSLPCSILFTGSSKERPKADTDYILIGRLVQRSLTDYTFKVKSWKKIDESRSLAEWRCHAKEKIRTILHHRISDPKTVAFLTALFTGDIDHRMLQFDFSRLGLQYLLVISGFHFAILAAFVLFVLRMVLSSRLRLYVLLLILSTYFLFVGNSPPVERSFLAVGIFLIGQIIQRQASGLNILGVCLIIEVILNPMIVHNIGFQLSFLSCLGIFLLHRPVQKSFTHVFPRRTFEEVQKLSIPSQCTWVVASFFSRAVYLTLAVNIALFPLLLFHFHRFPFLSLIYNLLAPAWTALSLFLLLLSLTLYAICPLFSLPFFLTTDFVSSNLLEFIGHPPLQLDYGLNFTFPSWAIAPYIACILLTRQATR